MIESIVLNHLKNNLDVPVYTETPSNPPKKYVLVDRTGGGLIEKTIRRATITIQSYASSLFEAAELNEMVIATMIKLPTNSNVSKVELNSDYEFNDPSKKEKRYQSVYDIVFYLM